MRSDLADIMSLTSNYRLLLQCGFKSHRGNAVDLSKLYPGCFYINLNISFIYTDIFIYTFIYTDKFAGNVYGYENLSVQNLGLILKKKMAAIDNCLKIIKVI